MLTKNFNIALNTLYKSTKRVPVNRNSKIVIFSDLHLGDGGRNDDFLHNSKLFISVMEKYYLKQDFTLILNGDIEELQRFNYASIFKRWEYIFYLFDQFQKRRKLYKLFGNHDYDINLGEMLHPQNHYEILESLILQYKKNDLFIFHGHQGISLINKYNYFITFILRYFANPLGIKNFSVSRNKKKKYDTEERIYDFSRKRKIISIIGHTHRPLFESLSKIDVLKYKIEQYCRDYVRASKKARELIELNIDYYRRELDSYKRKEFKKNLSYSLYAHNVIVPCLFNSGCAIGKKGITAIEIENNHIRLVYWFDDKVSKKYIDFEKYRLMNMPNTTIHKAIFNEDHLDYIFTRIQLLS